MKRILSIPECERLVAGLAQAKMTVGTAESCTGGLLGAAITAVSGSSSVYQGGLIAYSNEVKTNILGVSAGIIHAHGAVSQETAVAMAKGVRALMKTEVALSTTGIAGPTGGTKEKPVGTVWVGLSGPTGESARLFQLKGSRHDIQGQTVEAAVAWLLEYLDQKQKNLTGVT